MNVRSRRLVIDADRFERMSDSTGFELVDGRLKRKGAGAESSWVSCQLLFKLSKWSRDDELGFVFGTECPYRCFPGKTCHVRKPDGSFVKRGRLPGGIVPRNSLHLPPDFTFEVVSPNEKVYDLHRKIADFLSAGVHLIWVVYPDLRTVRVHRPGSLSEEYSEEEDLTADPVLPGFRVRVADLFPPPAPAQS